MNTNLVLNVLPRFPAHIRATDGLTIIVENGVDQVIKPNFGALVPVPAVTNPAMTYFQAWDKSIDYYQSISFQDFANNLAEQVLVGTLLALSEVTFAADQGIYFSDANTAHGYSLSTFVQSISGSADADAFKTALSLSKSDVGLANVDNTSDANKPVSTAQQTALNLKANLASPTFTGDPKAPTPSPGDNDTSIATTAFVGAAISTALSTSISKKFLSANQTITAAGPLTIGHGLGVVPEIVVAELECLTTDAGFAAGKVITVAPSANGLGTGGAAGNGFMMDRDASNIYVRYGSGTNPFQVLNGTSGVIVNLTNANWRFRVRAFA